ALPAVAQAKALAADVDGGGVVEEPVQERGGEDGVGEDLAPLAVALVAGEEDRLSGLVALAHGLEEEGGVGTGEGQVADLVEDEEVGAGDDPEQQVEAVLLARDARARDELVQREEVGAVAALDRLERQGGGEVRLADARGSEEEHVLALVEEAQRGEFLDHVPGHRGLSVEVEALERLGGGDARQLEVGLDPPLEAGGEFSAEQVVEDLDREALFLLAALEHAVQCGQGAVEPEAFELVTHAFVAHGGAHAAPVRSRSSWSKFS